MHHNFVTSGVLVLARFFVKLFLLGAINSELRVLVNLNGNTKPV